MSEDVGTTTCDWCLQRAPVQAIDERLWRFWRIISAERPLAAPLRSICSRCRLCYEGFSYYVERCKANATTVERVLASAREVSWMNVASPAEATPITAPRPVEGVPHKSRKRYTAAYETYCRWRDSTGRAACEDSLADYFAELAETASSPTLLAKYSMLKTCLRAYDDVDIARYAKLHDVLRSKCAADRGRVRSRVLTMRDVTRFCAEACDREFLSVKAALVIGIVGACRREELTRMTVRDVDDLGATLLVRVRLVGDGGGGAVDRSFVVVEEFYDVCRRYLEARRRVKEVDRFFLRMYRGRCTKQPMGVNRIGGIPREIATFLGLAEPESYTGHCFRRTSATLFLPPGVRMIDDEDDQ